MNKVRNLILFLIAFMAVIGFMTVIGFVGSYEFASEVVSSLSEEQYDTIVNDIGKDASEKQIARQYLDNREKYDSLK